MKMNRLKRFYLIVFLLLNTIIINSQNNWVEVAEADSSSYYNNFFIHGWLLYHKQYHRKVNNIIIDSVQFFNTPDTIELDYRNITKTYISADKSIDRIEELVIDKNDSLLYKIDYISYDKSDTLIRFNLFYFDTLILFVDYYYTNEKLLKRNVALNLNRDTLDDMEYFINGNKPYKMRWTHFNEVTKEGVRQYEEEYFYKGGYNDYRIRNVFNYDQSILFSYKDVRVRDVNNRLILEKYHTFDSIEMDYILDGYRIVYGAPLFTETKKVSNAKNNSLSSNGNIISWGQHLEAQSRLIILNTNGQVIFNSNLKEHQNTLVWPSFLRPGAYIVQIVGTELSLAKVLIKVP